MNSEALEVGGKEFDRESMGFRRALSRSRGHDLADESRARREHNLPFHRELLALLQGRHATRSALVKLRHLGSYFTSTSEDN